MIELRDVHKNLGGRDILKGVSMGIGVGETLVVVGASGTGKSVTLKHMVGLMHPDQGDVLIEGESIAHAGGRELERIRQKFGVLFQSGALIAWMSVAENVALPLYEHTKLGDDEIMGKVKETLALVNLDGADHKRPSEISGGMRKRVALARAIITQPRILLYDEPTSGLDPVMSRHVDNLIRRMQDELGVTSVVVTHDLHSAFSIGDQVAMLHEGRVAEMGPPQKFVESDNDYVREFIRAQFATGKLEGIPR